MKNKIKIVAFIINSSSIKLLYQCSYIVDKEVMVGRQELRFVLCMLYLVV